MIEAPKKNAAEADAFVCPVPLPRAEGHISYGGPLRPGKEDAIPQNVQQGKRIPRRGEEVGLSAEEIQKFESLDYVMSGSRHQRMNAIRIRKENQLYSAEDKRALAMFNYEEKAKREHKVMADLERLVQRHIGQDLGPTHDPFGKDSAAGDG
ncbi:NKAP family protein [Asparagus officinalis]|uniref:NKAP family protein n=1 Tax=Asparagus officinalis TaxID=4686 RepID=UPI00098E4211|nr:NKAP family protein [Asparagus officinalis]